MCLCVGGRFTPFPKKKGKILITQDCTYRGLVFIHVPTRSVSEVVESAPLGIFQLSILNPNSKANIAKCIDSFATYRVIHRRIHFEVC